MLPPDRQKIIADLLKHTTVKISRNLEDSLQLCDSELEILALMTGIALFVTEGVGAALGDDVPEYRKLPPERQYLLANTFVARHRVGNALHNPENLIALGAASAAIAAKIKRLTEELKNDDRREATQHRGPPGQP